MTDLKAAAEAAKAAREAYSTTKTHENHERLILADQDFHRACTEDAVIALYAERDDWGAIARKREEELLLRAIRAEASLASNKEEVESLRAELARVKPDHRAMAQAVAAERAAWEAELRPLIEAGAFEGVLFTTCEKCGALLTDDEVAPIEDGPKGCWRAATGRDKDNCPGEGRKRITIALTQEPTNAE